MLCTCRRRRPSEAAAATAGKHRHVADDDAAGDRGQQRIAEIGRVGDLDRVVFLTVAVGVDRRVAIGLSAFRLALPMPTPNEMLALVPGTLPGDKGLLGALHGRRFVAGVRLAVRNEIEQRLSAAGGNLVITAFNAVEYSGTAPACSLLM